MKAQIWAVAMLSAEVRGDDHFVTSLKREDSESGLKTTTTTNPNKQKKNLAFDGVAVREGTED